MEMREGIFYKYFFVPSIETDFKLGRSFLRRKPFSDEAVRGSSGTLGIFSRQPLFANSNIYLSPIVLL